MAPRKAARGRKDGRQDPKLPLPGETPDAYSLRLCAANRDLLVPHFLILSYLYYVKDEPLVSDQCFDEIARRLDAEWENIEHPHKALIDRALIKSGFYLQYPSIVIGAAERLRGGFAASVK